MSLCRSEPSTAQRHLREAATLLRKQVQYRIFKKVARLRKKLRKWPSAYIEAQEITTLPIQLSTFDLNPEAIDFEPHFCVPLARNGFERLLATAWTDCEESLQSLLDDDFKFCKDCDTSHNEMLRELIENQELYIDTGELSMLLGKAFDLISDGTQDAAAWGMKYPTKQYSLPDNQYSPHHWEAEELLFPRSPLLPHRAVVVQERSGLPDGRLFQSEAFLAAHLIYERMHLKAYSMHHTVPAFIFTVCGTKARVVQAHWSEDRLNIRTSNFLDFADYDIKKLELYLRWMMNTPCGDTMFKTLQLDEPKSRKRKREDFVTIPVSE